MAHTLDSTKIDGLVMVGAPAASEAASKLDGFVLIGNSPATLEVTKIDSFTMIGPAPPAGKSSVWASFIPRFP